MSDIRIHRIINSFFNSNTYIIYQDNYPDAWLIDCGDAESICEFADSLQKKIKGAFLTHTHYDHIYGLNRMLEQNPDFIVYTSSNGIHGLLSPKFNLSLYHDDNFSYIGQAIALKAGDQMKIFENATITAHETEGHDWSCLTYTLGNRIFTGDSYIPGIKTMASFPKSNKQKAATSEQYIKSLFKPGTIVCPGHNDILVI